MVTPLLICPQPIRLKGGNRAHNKLNLKHGTMTTVCLLIKAALTQAALNKLLCFYIKRPMVVGGVNRNKTTRQTFKSFDNRFITSVVYIIIVSGIRSGFRILLM